MQTRPLIQTVAVLASVATAAGVAAGTVAAGRGETRGAPGVSRSLSRLGRPVGGGMITGVAVSAGSAALVGLAVYAGISSLGR